MPAFLLRASLYPLPDLHGELRQHGQGDVLPRVQGIKCLRDRGLHLIHQLPPSTVKQPPAESEIPSIGIKVVPQRMCGIVVVMILQADGRFVLGRRSQGDYAGQVVPSTKEVQLDPSKDGQQGQDIDQRK